MPMDSALGCRGVLGFLSGRGNGRLLTVGKQQEKREEEKDTTNTPLVVMCSVPTVFMVYFSRIHPKYSLALLLTVDLK